jgi:hypothetical protein
MNTSPTKPEQDSFIDPSYKRTSHGHRVIDGVAFVSYHTGVMSYAKIGADGKIMVWSGNTHRAGPPTYFANVIGHGPLKGRGNTQKRFRSEDAACRAAVKIWREMSDD